MQEVKAEDAINDNLPMPWRFGYMHSVDYGLNDGEWHTLENGDRIWRLLITSRDALTLNFIFDDFYMPEGGYIFFIMMKEQTFLEHMIRLKIKNQVFLEPG